ncbi:MAG: primosomal protein N', partial [Dehalococcoidia bacterium]|nr:primosomal protein N' [Dehalococcoidia bacterium]
ARWLSRHYLSPLFHAVTLMLPPGFTRPSTSFFRPGPNLGHGSTLEEEAVLETVRREWRVGLESLAGAMGQRRASRALKGLVARGLLTQEWQIDPPRVRPKRVAVVRLLVDKAQALEIADTWEKRAPARAALLRLLTQRGQVPRAALGELRSRVAALEKAGMLVVEQLLVRRDPLSGHDPAPYPPHVLSLPQDAALYHIRKAMERRAPAAFLLQGVTGSGKTEVYLRALEHALSLGRRGMVLVPEISLTPQTIDRFASRFPGRVAVLHSGLSLGEQYDGWWAIRGGDYSVVIGTRSALFAPQPDLGLIVLDEEHEWAFKEGDRPPRYHAREAAMELARQVGAVVVLGSATPDVGIHHLAREGGLGLLELPDRIGPSSLPSVEVVDMRRELRAGNRSLFSRSLRLGLFRALGAGEKAILFLNRRGTSPFVRCRSCGHVMECRRCTVSLSFHREQGLVCHQCGYRRSFPLSCPTCGRTALDRLGLGTERVETELSAMLPGVEVVRWDRDAVRGRGGHRDILSHFAQPGPRVLVGTQMVAKGLDLPRVTLVGVVLADTGIHFPDFRSGERTFQLISQVSGRAGRGEAPGRVIVQTYCPDHYAIQAAAAHDYASFYEKEMEYRRRHRYPPFSRLVRLVYAHTNAQRSREASEGLRRRLLEARDTSGLVEVEVIGPTPCFVSRLRGRFRWQLLLRGSDPAALLEHLSLPQGWVVDVDPVQLL